MGDVRDTWTCGYGPCVQLDGPRPVRARGDGVVHRARARGEAHVGRQALLTCRRLAEPARRPPAGPGLARPPSRPRPLTAPAPCLCLCLYMVYYSASARGAGAACHGEGTRGVTTGRTPGAARRARRRGGSLRAGPGQAEESGTGGGGRRQEGRWRERGGWRTGRAGPAARAGPVDPRLRIRPVARGARRAG